MANRYRIVLLPGDGIGPEVIHHAVRIMDALAKRLGIELERVSHPVGGAAIDAYNNPMPDEIVEDCKKSDAVLLGAVGGPQWDHHTGAMRPESGLLKIRRELGVFANLRPVVVPDCLAEASPLRDKIVRGTDLLIVRELTGGIYFGQPQTREREGSGEKAVNSMVYTSVEIERVVRIAFEWARKRGGRVTSVDKANVLVVSQLWRDIANRVHQNEFPDLHLEHMYVDNAAMQLVLNPRQFDVIVTGNLFGDILSDVAATLGGSLGLLPSASVGGSVGLFEPVHGSAPDLVGQEKANPIAAILSMAMMFDQFGESAIAAAIRMGVVAVLESGARTSDLWRDGLERTTTTEMTDRILNQAIRSIS